MSKLLAFVALFASAHAFAGESTRPVTAQGLAAAPASAGMRIYRDPKTGEFTAVRPESLAKTAEASVAAPDYNNVEVQILPDGSRMARATDREFHSAAVAKLGPDGEVHENCVQGSADATTEQPQ